MVRLRPAVGPFGDCGNYWVVDPMKEADLSGPKPHPLDCRLCGRWWVVAFTEHIDWPPLPPQISGEYWPDPIPEWICLCCGAEYRDSGDSIVYTGRVVDDEEMLLPGFATIREMKRDEGDYQRDDLDDLRVMKSYDDETVYHFDDDSE